MHSLLEAYLSDLSAHLLSLPVKRREEELREMRAHLLNAVIVNREQGQTEDAAAQAAVAQFGSPEAVSQDTVTAWRRGVMLSRRSFWGAAACTLMLTFVLPMLAALPEKAYLRRFDSQSVSASSVAFVVLLWLVTCLFAGGIAGLLFPRRAVAAAGLAWAVRTVLNMAGTYHTLTHTGNFSVPLNFVLRLVLTVVFYNVAGAFLCLLGAWLVSRWQTRRMRMVRA